MARAMARARARLLLLLFGASAAVLTTRMSTLGLALSPPSPRHLPPPACRAGRSVAAAPVREGGRAVARATALAASGTGSEAVAFIKEQWQGEAERCWTEDDSGVVPGWVGDFTQEGREYDPLTRSYFDADQKAQPTESRPWRRLEGEPDAQAEVEGDPRLQDFGALLDFLGDGAGGTVLDLGCGEGFMSRQLIRTGRFQRVFALDADWRRLEAARSAAEEERLGPEQGLLLMRGDVQHLPFRDGLVDGAWWGMGAHTVQDSAACLASIAASLRPGGKLLATTIGGSGAGPGRAPEDLEAKAKAAGFSEVAVEKSGATMLVLRAVK